MAACVPYYQWLTANAACRAKSAGIDVKGFGYTRTGVAGLRGLRGLGASMDFSITPSSVATAIQGGGVIQTPPPSAPPVVSQPTLNTTPVYDPSDPCYIAQQTPCPMGTGCPAGCPTGYHSVNLLVAPGKPAQCVCAQDKALAPTYPSGTFAPHGAPATAPPSNTVPILQSNTAAGGFSHWGLLAAVAVGGTALYLVMRKKKAA